jgi:uncharacterized protein YcbK (DUF882 family)
MALTGRASAQAASPPLWVRIVATGEEYRIPLFVSGRRHALAQRALDWLFRDHRENAGVMMDRRLYDMLYFFQHLPGRGARVDVTSGYRTPKTNNMLRDRGEGAAVNSLHIEGMAVDFRVQGMDPEAVARIGWSYQYGGIGLYDGFTHFDTGRPRKWGRSF